MSNKNQLSAGTTTLIAFVVGLVFIAVGASMTYSSYTFTRTAITTNGTVTYVKESRSSNSNGSIKDNYMPTISFFDDQGRPQSAQTPVSNQDYNFPLGTELSILYSRDNPSQIKLNKWFELWGFGTVFLATGFGILAYIIFAWQESKKPSVAQKKQENSIDDLNEAVKHLRMMGRDAEADEVVKRMQSTNVGTSDLD
ncbi:DUF3592 domain-containing protein [Yoonia sp. MH D7]